MDGLSCEFYKVVCDTISDDFYCLSSEVFTSGRLLEFLNQGLFKFIPKNVVRDSIKGWHPIT
jgi:hypothetical protein